jgi:GT2 family glycosyltransferase
MKLSIVILNWNGREFLKRFLPSIVKYSSYPWSEIIVADNGSDDKSRDVVEQQFPSVKFLALGHNYGFAEGYNKALSLIDSDYFLLLNSDVEVTQDWLIPLLECMEKNPLVGACHPKILQMDQPEKFEYAGAAGGFIDYFGFPFCRGRIMNIQETDTGQYDQSIPVFWASGAAMLVRSSVWKKMEGFDSDFYAHMEEIDLCWRMLNHGYKIMVCPSSKVYHLGGGSLAYGNPKKIFLNFRNNLFLLYKNLPKNKLYAILLPRMILDGVAALQFLITGQFIGFRKVYQAHISFYRNKSSLKAKRKELLNKIIKKNHPEIYKGSIVWDFFIMRKKKFSDLNFPPGK